MIKILKVYHALIARYGPYLKNLTFEPELEFELRLKFFLLI